MSRNPDIRSFLLVSSGFSKASWGLSTRPVHASTINEQRVGRLGDGVHSRSQLQSCTPHSCRISLARTSHMLPLDVKAREKCSLLSPGRNETEANTQHCLCQ